MSDPTSQTRTARTEPEPGRTQPDTAAPIVDRLGHHVPGSAESFTDLSALWSAHMQTGNEYARRAYYADDVADPQPADVARVTALQGAARASFDAATDIERDIYSVVDGIETAAHEAGAAVHADE